MGNVDIALVSYMSLRFPKRGRLIRGEVRNGACPRTQSRRLMTQRVGGVYTHEQIGESDLGFVSGDTHTGIDIFCFLCGMAFVL